LPARQDTYTTYQQCGGVIHACSGTLSAQALDGIGRAISAPLNKVVTCVKLCKAVLPRSLRVWNPHLAVYAFAAHTCEPSQQRRSSPELLRALLCCLYNAALYRRRVERGHNHRAGCFSGCTFCRSSYALRASGAGCNDAEPSFPLSTRAWRSLSRAFEKVALRNNCKPAAVAQHSSPCEQPQAEQ
jgi:hypothetical protein